MSELANSYSTTSEEEKDQLAEALKAMSDSSLIQAEEPETAETTEETSETQETAEQETEETQEKPSETTEETSETQETVENTETPVLTQEMFDNLQAELEAAKAGKSPDLDWLKSEQGKLYMRDDIDGEIDIETQGESLFLEMLVKEDKMSAEDANDELEYKYGILFEDDADTNSAEYKAAYRRFTKEVNGYVDRLREEKSGLEVPFQQAAPSGVITPEQFEDQYKGRLNEDYQQRVNTRKQIAENLIERVGEKFNVSVGETTFEYEPSQDVKDKIAFDIADLENIGAQFVNKDGTVSESLFLLLALKNDQQTVLEGLLNVKDSQTRKDTIQNEVKNTSFTKKSPVSQEIDMDENDPRYEATKALARGEY